MRRKLSGASGGLSHLFWGRVLEGHSRGATEGHHLHWHTVHGRLLGTVTDTGNPFSVVTGGGYRLKQVQVREVERSLLTVPNQVPSYLDLTIYFRGVTKFCPRASTIRQKEGSFIFWSSGIPPVKKGRKRIRPRLSTELCRALPLVGPKVAVIDITPSHFLFGGKGGRRVRWTGETGKRRSRRLHTHRHWHTVSLILRPTPLPNHAFRSASTANNRHTSFIRAKKDPDESKGRSKVSHFTWNYLQPPTVRVSGPNSPVTSLSRDPIICFLLIVTPVTPPKTRKGVLTVESFVPERKSTPYSRQRCGDPTYVLLISLSAQWTNVR